MTRFLLPLLLLLAPAAAASANLGFLTSPSKPASLQGPSSSFYKTRIESKPQALNLHVKGAVHGRRVSHDLATLLQRRDLDAEGLCKLCVQCGPQFLREDDMGLQTTELAFERLRELWKDENQNKEWLTRALWMLTIVSKA